MNLQQYHHWSQLRQARLAADPDVLGLVALGSYAPDYPRQAADAVQAYLQAMVQGNE